MELLQKRAYVPYSDRKEYCLIEGASGTVYPGVRVENSSFPLTISSMQAAISSCLANNDEPLFYSHGFVKPELISYWVSEYSLKEKETLKSSSVDTLYNAVEKEPTDISGMLKSLNNHAVTPNSNFPVSAILETERGFVKGVNVEGSSWALGLCAERVAISRAIAAGAGNFITMHIMAPKSSFASPCGACRQVIHEFMPKKQVQLYHKSDQKTTHISEHLLPYAFTTTSL